MDQLHQKISQFNEDWIDLKRKHNSLIDSTTKLKEQEKLCVKGVKHCRNYIKFLKTEINKLYRIADADDKTELDLALLNVQKKEYEIRDIEDVLPRTAGLYLRIVLGALNISFTTKEEKFTYKNDYEQFKIIVSGICAIFAFMLYFIQNRTMDTVFHFLLVWYYCTLTIRERILIANGSRIKGWWNIYHFISTVNAGIMLIWPRSQSYDKFHDQFMIYSLYINLIHCVQYQYQMGCLYKLRSLGRRHAMDITVDGFMSWMFRRLTFILPFLFSVYLFQLYNSYKLYAIHKQTEGLEWQVLAVSIIFLVLACGSMVTVFHVVLQKIRRAPDCVLRRHLTQKYSFSYDDDLDTLSGERTMDSNDQNKVFDAQANNK